MCVCVFVLQKNDNQPLEMIVVNASIFPWFRFSDYTFVLSWLFLVYIRDIDMDSHIH